MSQSLILKINEEPTWWNKEMAIGTFIFPGIGTLVGGLIGKRRMEREKAQGKIVTDTPSFWSRDALLGTQIGLALGSVAGLIMSLAAGPEASALATVLSIASRLVGTWIGMYVGGKAGEARQTQEYQEAVQQNIITHLGQSTSPEIAQAVEYRMTHDKEWSKKVLEEKLLGVGQKPGLT